MYCNTNVLDNYFFFRISLILIAYSDCAFQLFEMFSKSRNSFFKIDVFGSINLCFIDGLFVYYEYDSGNI